MENRPHVLIFPLPLQGPVNSMLKLAELLSLSDIDVTFLVTDHIHSRLLRYTNTQSHFSRYPRFRFETISDGLPADHPRGQPLELFESLKSNSKSLFKELLNSGSGRLSSGPRLPVTCIIADGTLSFSLEVGEEIGIPVIYTRTISACCLWVLFSLPKLIESGELPFKGKDLDELITSVPGMEDFLRRRDLPIFCRSDNVNDPNLQHFKTERKETTRAKGLILNTFEDLEGPILAQIRTLSPNLYTIGPLHAYLKTRLASGTKLSLSSSSLWEEDKSCIKWLDSQQLKSVIYVSFGSLAVMTKDQLIEFWYGLVNSGKHFLWVIRADLVAGEDWKSQIPTELSEGTKDRGYIVGWAPQEEVLAHPAIGGFLTHSGWNSTLECVYEGVPMICWPYFLDQQVNSRFVGQVWKVGLDMKDICHRSIIEKTVNDLMEVRRDEFLRSANHMALLAKKSVSDGGSSHSNLNRLIEDIRLMSSQVGQC